MKNRYICGFRANSEIDPYYDVLIIGSGIAGLYTALNLSTDLRVLVITKNTVTEGNSSLAQGGIAAAMEADDYQLHILDTLKAGCYHNLPEAVKIIVEEGRENILRLIELGVNFDRDESGDLVMTREGGHSQSRILHSKDATGREVMRALSESAINAPNIEILEYVQALDLMTDASRCLGAVVYHDEKIKPIWANHVVLATGGIGQLYRHTTNSVIASGDGIAMAQRASVQVSDMEFIQFHPTALYSPNYDRNFLISEAVRGEGGILRNPEGVAFMENVHPLKDLAPRDIVAREILKQMKTYGKPYVYLDVTHLDSDYLKERFPNIYERCLTEGIDITQDFIPICPVEHYLMGGVVADLNGKTSLSNLFACGEVAKTGTHGANRLASNSLLEGLVFGRRIAQSINLNPSLTKLSLRLEGIGPLNIGNSDDGAQWVSEIQGIMSEYVSIFRTFPALAEAQYQLEQIEKNMAGAKGVTESYFKACNMLTVAQLIVKAALNRGTSLGSHVIDSSGGLS